MAKIFTDLNKRFNLTQPPSYYYATPILSFHFISIYLQYLSSCFRDQFDEFTKEKKCANL